MFGFMHGRRPEQQIGIQESMVMARIGRGFDGQAWPDKATWQRIYDQATAEEERDEPRSRHRLAFAAAVSALALAIAAAALFSPIARKGGRDVPLTSGSAVARGMLDQLRVPGKVTHYLIRQYDYDPHLQTQPGKPPKPRLIDCWVDGDNGLVKSIERASIAPNQEGTSPFRLRRSKRHVELAIINATIEAKGRIVSGPALALPPRQRKGKLLYVTNTHLSSSPANVLADPMSGGLSKYVEMLQDGRLQMLGTATIRGIPTYKLLCESKEAEPIYAVGSEYAGRLSNHTSSTIYAGQETLQPVRVVSVWENRESLGAKSSDVTRTSYWVTEFLKAETLNRRSLPDDFFDASIPKGAQVAYMLNMGIDQARSFSAFDLYYLGDSFGGISRPSFFFWRNPTLPYGRGGPAMYVTYQSDGLTRTSRSRFLQMVVFPKGGNPLKNPQVKMMHRNSERALVVGRIKLSGGALAGRTAYLIRRWVSMGTDFSGSANSQTLELCVSGPGSTVVIGGPAYTTVPGSAPAVNGPSRARILKAANSLKKVN